MNSCCRTSANILTLPPKGCSFKLLRPAGVLKGLFSYREYFEFHLCPWCCRCYPELRKQKDISIDIYFQYNSMVAWLGHNLKTGNSKIHHNNQIYIISPWSVFLQQCQFFGLQYAMQLFWVWNQKWCSFSVITFLNPVAQFPKLCSTSLHTNKY